jgi:hypothetical protein
MNRRALIGFAIAPLLPCLFAGIYNAVRQGSAAPIVGDTLRYAMLAYPAALLLGIPAYWLMTRGGPTGWHTKPAFVVAVGAGLGAISGVVLPLIVGDAAMRPFVSGLYPIAIEFGFFGAFTAWVFVWIAKR